MPTYRIERFENTSFASIPTSTHRKFATDEEALAFASHYTHAGPNGQVNVYRLIGMMKHNGHDVQFREDYATGGDHTHSISLW